MSIYGNPVMLGGSGGGGGTGNAWSGTSAPSDAVGENGQYYFQLSTDNHALVNDPASNANTGTAGWEFTAASAITIVGVRAMARSSYTGTVKFGEAGGTILKEVGVSLVAGQWVEAMFDSPVTLTTNTHYIVMLFGNSSTLLYQRSPTLRTNAITYVRGRYGGFPGTNESGTAYSVDVLYQIEPPYPIKSEYYKSGGTWSQV